MEYYHQFVLANLGSILQLNPGSLLEYQDVIEKLWLYDTDALLPNVHGLFTYRAAVKLPARAFQGANP